MAKALGEPSGKFETIAEDIKLGINNHLWLDEKGYYAQYLYGKHYLMASPRFEALGAALSVIFDIADENRAEIIVSKSPLTTFGVTCIYPQISGIPPYHNDAIWPFVQAYWNLAAAKAGNEKVLSHGLASIYRAAGLFLSNYENMDTRSGDFKATEINSHQMLWSIAGNLAMVHRVFFGMDFQQNKLSFHPVIPSAYTGTKQLRNFAYRKATLDITVNGHGNEISSITIDGKQAMDAEIPADWTGRHTVEIQMANNAFDGSEINLVANHYTLPNPIAKLYADTLKWNPSEGAASYLVYENGKASKYTDVPYFVIDASKGYTEYAVSACDRNGMGSFISEPISTGANPKIIEMEAHAKSSDKPFLNYTGTGFVEVAADLQTAINIPLSLDSGAYIVDVRYSNGSGHWNTDNKCAIRSLSLDGTYIGPVVMPQRGLDEWSDWGYSNTHVIHLPAGKHNLKLSFEDWNINMDGMVNRAMIDHVRLFPLE
jgi:hypothetical protein